MSDQNTEDLAVADNADDIFATEDLETKPVPVPEWGRTVLVKGLTGTERDAWEASLRVRVGDKYVPDSKNMRAKLVGRALVKPDGTRLFRDEQIPQLGTKSAKVLDRLYDIVTEMSGIGEKAEQDAEGNSEVGLSDGSTSSLPTSTESLSVNSSPDGPLPS